MILAIASLPLLDACAKPPAESRSSDAGLALSLGAEGSTARLPLAEEPHREMNAAARCGECHVELYSQWKESTHAKAGKSDAFQRMRHAAGATGQEGECAHCHEPLARIVEPGDPALRDGVACEVCHTISAVDVAARSANFRFSPEEHTKYGPICDAKDHYFHKMGCSPLHSKSRFCAGCHHWSSKNLEAAGILVLSEYEEWRLSPYAKREVECQDCHMPWNVAALAEGSPTRVNASHHGFRGATDDLRAKALTVSVAQKTIGDRVELTISLKNSGAGHSVPTGLPERRIVLEAASLDAAAKELERVERVYGKALVNESGQPAPFFSATKQASDTRIGAEEERKEVLELSTAGVAWIETRVVRFDVAEDIARAIGYAPQREVIFKDRKPFGRGKPQRVKKGATLPTGSP